MESETQSYRLHKFTSMPKIGRNLGEHLNSFKNYNGTLRWFYLGIKEPSIIPVDTRHKGILYFSAANIHKKN